MKNVPTTIIAFFARGREIGFVILEEQELVRYGVKTIKGNRQGSAFPTRVETALASFCAMGGSSRIVVVERPSRSSRTGALCNVIGDLTTHWKRTGFPVYTLSLNEAKRRICGDPKATHRAVLQRMIERYPRLWPVVTLRKAQNATYWEKVGLVMALADVATHRFSVL